MKWRKIKKLMKEHPYIVVKEASASMSKARQELQEEGYPSFFNMVEKAKATSSIPASTWAVVDRTIARRAKKKTDRSGMFIHMLFRFRRVAIVGLCLILLTGFFTLVPAGRALASQFIEFVIEVVEGWGLIKSSESNAPAFDFDSSPEIPAPSEIEEVPGDLGMEQQDFQSIMEFQNATGLTPYYIDSEIHMLDSMTYINDPDFGQVLTTVYTSVENVTRIVQTWGKEQSRVIVPDNQVHGSIKRNDIEYKYYWDETDNSLNVFCILYDSSIKITSQDFDFSLDNLHGFLDKIIEF